MKGVREGFLSSWGRHPGTDPAPGTAPGTTSDVVCPPGRPGRPEIIQFGSRSGPVSRVRDGVLQRITEDPEAPLLVLNGASSIESIEDRASGTLEPP